MISVYLAGYMTSPDSKRPDWRGPLMEETQKQWKMFGGQSIVDIVGIKWLCPLTCPGFIPGSNQDQSDLPRLYVPRDEVLVRKADLIVAYIDTRMATGIGASYEMGLARGLNKPIMMIDITPENTSWDLNRNICCAIYKSIPEAAKALAFSAL